MSVAQRTPSARSAERASERAVAFVDVPAARYLAVDGCERPGSQSFMNAIATLYPIAHALHLSVRRAGRKAPAGHLECLYWLSPEGQRRGTPAGETHGSEQSWSWRLLMRVPDEASDADVEHAIAAETHRCRLPAISRLHVLRWTEGPCAQLLHVGPYGEERGTVQRLRTAVEAAGGSPVGPLHEIYLNDPGRVGEARTRTIVRLAIKDATAEDE